MVYDVETNNVTTSPGISTERRENMPVWSADGKYLYFISAPEAIKGDEESLLHSKYSLMRIAYDPDQNLWGEAEMVLNSDSTGMSTSMPSVSPDGKYLVCSMSDYGYFTIFHKKSDLYSVDLETKEYRKLEINSSSAESYSTWASNSRWLVFSSKRIDDVFTRPFIAYIDEHGAAHTPFVMPQEDPEMYDRLLANYNRPELITGKIELTPVQVRNTVFSDPKKVNPDN
jgi:Tol biopolymer transport system component